MSLLLNLMNPLVSYPAFLVTGVQEIMFDTFPTKNNIHLHHMSSFELVQFLSYN